MLLTVCNVNHNQADAVALMRESLLHYHPDLALCFYGWDNGSTDGAAEYMERHYYYLHREPANSGYPPNACDALCKAATTPYTLLIDSDTEFTGEVLNRAIEQLAEHTCVTVTPLEDMGTNVIDGRTYVGQQRIDSAFSLWRTWDLQKLLQFTSWSRYWAHDLVEWYDGGAMLYRFAQCAGMNVLRDASIWDNFTHFGEISALWLGSGTDAAWLEKRAILAARYRVVREHLQELRGKNGNSMAT